MARPIMDIFFIFIAVEVIPIYVFADQLHVSIVQTVILGCILYAVIARIIIKRVEGATFGYVRGICEVANGNTLLTAPSKWC